VFSQKDSSILEPVKLYLLQQVAMFANQIDSNSQDLSTALRGLGDLGLLALRLPQSWGGKGVGEETFADFQELVARYSGALAFLQTQHQSAVGMIVASSNSHLQEKYLPQMHNGKCLLGVGFSQLRRTGKPTITALPVLGGYELNGFVPWITGYGIFSEFIVAATLPDGSAVFGIVPFQETQQSVTGGRITFSQPAQLAAMTSTNTVSANVSSYFLATEQVVFIKPDGWIHENDKKNVLRAGFLATGCALAGLDVILTASEQKSLPCIANALASLQQELDDCRTAMRKVQQQPEAELSEKLQMRSWAIELATRIAHAAVTVSGGAANYNHHHAQRIYREALVFTVTGQTTAVMAATLARLVR
jgi:alkylation response protein AidB-like acyl-CoA dehydrogenase